MQYTCLLLVVLLFAAVGCGGEVHPSGDPAPVLPPPTAGSKYDASSCGTLQGRVVWSGDVPQVAPEMAGVPTGTGYTWTEIANPWAPVIDQATKGIADVILSLEGIDPEWMKPWDLPDVTCEVVASRINIRQGDSTLRRVGIIRVGDEVPIQSGDAGHHMLRARGSAFFTLPFPEPRKSLLRQFEKPGFVELSSGAGYYWHAADLLVVTHPYHAVSDQTGSFTFLNVPPGTYSLIVRIRSWHVVSKERDPETGLIFRQSYAPPVEVRIPVTIRSNEPTLTTVLVPASQFPVR